MSVTVILEAQVKPGQKKELLGLLMQYLPDTKKYKGFIAISIHSEVNSDAFVFLSEWQSVQCYQNYLQWRIDSGVMKTLASLFTSDPVIRYFDCEISNGLQLVGEH